MPCAAQPVALAVMPWRSDQALKDYLLEPSTRLEVMREQGGGLARAAGECLLVLQWSCVSWSTHITDCHTDIQCNAAMHIAPLVAAVVTGGMTAANFGMKHLFP